MHPGDDTDTHFSDDHAADNPYASPPPVCCSCRCDCRYKLCSENSPREPRPFEMEMYKAQADLFNSEETSFWTRNNILVIVQVGLIAAIASLAGDVDKLPLNKEGGVVASLFLLGALFVIALVGFFTSLGWVFMVHRSTRIADAVSSNLKAMENAFFSRMGKKEGESFNAFISFGDRLEKTDKSLANFFLTAVNSNTANLPNSYRLSRVWLYVVFAFLVIWLILTLSTAAGLLRTWFHTDVTKEKLPVTTQDEAIRIICCQGHSDQKAVRLTFEQLGTVGPFCSAQHDEQSCDAKAPDQPLTPDRKALQTLVEKIHAMDLLQLVLVGSADRENLMPGLKNRYGSNAGLARARAEWVLEQLKSIWRQEYPNDLFPAALLNAQVLTVGPKETNENANEAKDRAVYVYVMARQKMDE